MKASNKQIGYLVKLARDCGVEVEFDDFMNKHGEPLISSQEASDEIKNYLAQMKQDDSCDVQRKKIISMAMSIGWTLPNPQDPSRPKANMKSIYSWVLKYGYLHKSLNEYTEKEIPKLVSQFQNGPFAHKLKSVENGK